MTDRIRKTPCNLRSDAAPSTAGDTGQPPTHRHVNTNDSWEDTIVREDEEIVSDEVLEERGQGLAIRVQNELGTDGWEVLYHLGGRVHRVCPPGSWPAETWWQDLLGYAPPDPREIGEEEARILEGLREYQQQADTDDPPPTES